MGEGLGVLCLLLRRGHLPGGEADWVDGVSEPHRPPQVEQGHVPVQVLLPVVLWVYDDLADGHNLLDAALESVKNPGENSLPPLALINSQVGPGGLTRPGCVSPVAPGCRWPRSSCSRAGRGCSEPP